MKDKLRKFLKLDRRWIFLLLTIVMFWPIIKPLGLASGKPASQVEDFYNFVDTLKPGDFVLLGVDYDPSTKPELHPQAVAVLRHLFSRNVRVAMRSPWRITSSANTALSSAKTEAGIIKTINENINLIIFLSLIKYKIYADIRSNRFSFIKEFYCVFKPRGHEA